MAVTNGYLTEEEARAYVGRNDSKDPALLEDIVTAASRLIDRHCGRHFYQQAATARIFDSRDRHCVEFGPFNDLVSVTTLKYDSTGDGTYDTTVSASNYQLHPVGATTKGPQAEPYTSVVILNGLDFPVPSEFSTGRVGLIEVTGTWGWPSVPLEVKQAARIIVAEVAKLQDAPLGTYAGPMDSVAYVRNNLPPRARDLLAPFRHPLNFGLA